MPSTIVEVISGLGMGGAEKSFLNRLQNMPPGFNTIVINTRPELDSWTLPSGIQSIECSRKKFRFFSRLGQGIDRFSPDVVITRTPIDLMAVSLAKFLFRGKWKLVYEAHSVVVSQSLFVSVLLIPFMRLAISKADLVIAVSKSVASGRQCRGAKKLVLFHIGAIAKVKTNAKRNFSFLFVGRFVTLKQPLLLLEAIRLCAEAFLYYGAKVKLIGKGPLVSEISTFIKINNLEEIVELCGYLENLDSIYSESEFLVSTSKFEGLPITFFEAKLHGLRILTTPSSGDFDILGPEDCVLDDFTVDSLVEALKVALASGQVSEESRKSVQRRNMWMQVEQRAIVYYELVGNELIEAVPE